MATYAKYKDLGEQENAVNQHIPEAIEIQSVEHKQQLISTNRVCVIDISGSWCGPCKAIAPRYNQLAQQYTAIGRCVLAKEDVDKGFSPNVRGVPTFQIFKEGRLVNTIVGADISKVEENLIDLLK